ncbi:hypothetical protein EDM00_11505 [Ornithobacterium rhinotracheale]|uniref:hypothetical protein n=1 Tax=Ornithobacterium rhinotracheale TaxID=28251 RepID=UPI00129CC41C|nr:hypothetical protein [Ornithobacterium rhinotracheale]MRI64605.1 hypothetical protein [Ornithobacterium rhinotracheale]
MNEKIIIELEDKGQDFTKIICDKRGIILETRPFQTEMWKGGIIPIREEELFAIDKECPIHKPPIINYGFLKYKIKNIISSTNKK